MVPKRSSSLCIQSGPRLGPRSVTPSAEGVPLVAAENADRRADTSGQRQLREQPNEERSFHERVKRQLKPNSLLRSQQANLCLQKCDLRSINMPRGKAVYRKAGHPLCSSLMRRNQTLQLSDNGGRLALLPRQFNSRFRQFDLSQAIA